MDQVNSSGLSSSFFVYLNLVPVPEDPKQTDHHEVQTGSFPDAASWIILTPMKEHPSAIACWLSERIAQTRRWIETWKLAGADLQRIRRKEIRELDTYRTIALLCGPSD